MNKWTHRPLQLSWPKIESAISKEHENQPGWWLFPTHLKNMRKSNWIISPRDPGWTLKNSWNHHLAMRYMPILNQSQPPPPNSRPREHSFHPPVKHQVPVPWVQTSKAMNWPTRSSQCSSDASVALNYYTPWKSRWCNSHISYHGPFTCHLQAQLLWGAQYHLLSPRGELGISMSWVMAWSVCGAKFQFQYATFPNLKKCVSKKMVAPKNPTVFYWIHF